MYQFTDDIRIGIKEIDDDHKPPLPLIEEAQNMLGTSGIDVRMVATEVIQRLRTYAATHFAHEEAYMKKIGDSELPSQPFPFWTGRSSSRRMRQAVIL